MRSIYISIPPEAVDRLRDLAWRERRSPRQQAAVLVLAGLDRESGGASPQHGRPRSARATARRAIGTPEVER
jgi:hypothetical protein